ncbi:TonB-dependent receptor [Hymenobacter saemangeumensis]|uniref:TonB-dependent receptor n=1 Tax=Hymenobacter saemangeumensis TaxID=1084522 RepID=A0ABP8IDX0_9BACT
MDRLFLLFLFGLLLGGACAAQAQSTGQVRGTVLDSASGKPLREISVSLLAAKDSSYVTFSITDGDGRYNLRGLRPGKYLLLINALGYRPEQHPVELTAAQPSVEMPVYRPRPESRQLGEVVVTHERAPVSINGDTLAFNARAFKTQPNANVEALLKKLPGVEVARDGSIRAQGQDVSRVLVDGKPFFGDDPRMATRNLPANIIDNVQLYDQQSDQAAFSGMDNGDRSRTINLVTRRDKRKGYFGTESVGAGTDGRYQARLGLNRFNNGRQISLLGQADNVNQQGFGDDPTPTGDGAGLGGPEGRGGQGGSTPVLVTPGGQRRNLGGVASPTAASITESASAGFNYRDAWGKRAEVAGSLLGTRARVTTDEQLRRQNLSGLAEAAPVTDRHSYDRTRSSSLRFNFRLDYKLDSLTSLRFTPYLSTQASGQRLETSQQTAAGSRLLNQGSNRYEADASSYRGGGNLLLMRKFRREGRTFSTNLSSSLTDQRGEALNQGRNTFFDRDGSPLPAQVLNQRFDQLTPAQTHVLNFSYTEPLSLRKKLEVHAALTDTRNVATRTAADFNEASGRYDQPNLALSNDFGSRYQSQRGGLTLQTRRLRYSYSLGLDAQQAQLRAENQSTDEGLSRRFQALLPTASFSYTGAGSRQLRLNYRTRLNAPSGSQLQPVPDNSNPFSIRLGNPELRPEYAHQLNVTYSQFNAATNRSLFALLLGSQVQNRITSSTTFSPSGVQTVRPTNADGYHSLTGFLSLGQRFAARKLNLNASTNGNYTRALSFVNEQQNEARTWSLGQTLSANSSYNEHLELGLSANLTYENARYSLLPAQNTAYFTQTVTADALVQLPGRWVLTTDAWYTNNTGRAAGYNQRVLLWNAALAYQLFANKQGEIKLQAYDLLNQNRSVTRNATDVYVEDVRSQVLRQYFLLSFTYQLRQFGK